MPAKAGIQKDSARAPVLPPGFRVLRGSPGMTCPLFTPVVVYERLLFRDGA